jgi:hypothetical protein
LEDVARSFIDRYALQREKGPPAPSAALRRSSGQQESLNCGIDS